MSKKTAKTTTISKELLSYDPRDIVLGKVRGYPPWPGMVVDPDKVPPHILRERPTNKKTNFYCVRFFPAGDYAWLVAKDISKLQTHEIESYIAEPFKRSEDLLQGYRIALDPKKWEDDREAALLEAAAADEAQAGAGIDEEFEDEVDELANDEDADSASTKRKSRKRKRESDAAGSQKEKKTKAKKATADGPRRKSGARKNGSKSKTMVESEDEGDTQDAQGEEIGVTSGKKSSPPPSKKQKREKEEEGDDAKLASDPEAIKVREWRHRLQKAFLGKTIPKEEDTPTLDTLFSTVENYESMSVAYLQFSKIGKVMRHIAVLDDSKVPKDAEYKFRERAKALVDKWHGVLNANKPAAPSAAPATTTNGNTAASLDDAAAIEAPTANGAPEAASTGHPADADESKDDKAEGVTAATAAIDLNGNKDSAAAAPVQDFTEQVTIDPADTSVLADVTMSEA